MSPRHVLALLAVALAGRLALACTQAQDVCKHIYAGKGTACNTCNAVNWNPANGAPRYRETVALMECTNAANMCTASRPPRNI